MSVTHYDWLDHHAERVPEKEVWVDLHSNRHFTYAEANDRALRLAFHFQENCGIGKGDRVGVLAMNSTDMLEIQAACAKIGAIFLPLNWRLTVSELDFIIRDAGPKILIYDTQFASEISELKEKTGVQHTLETSGGGGNTPYEAAIQAANPTPRLATVTHDDVWTIMYTSGTTGLPKGAMNTYGMAFYNAVNLGIPTYFTPNAKTLTILPLFHTGGLNCYSSVALYFGGTTLVMRAFDPGECLRLINDEEIGLTHFFGVPANYLFMSQHPVFATTDFSRLACSGVGGAPTPVPLLETYKARGLALQQGYGMTETSPTVTVQDAEMAFSRPGSAGKLALNAEARIVDENGVDVPRGKTGELWVKGPNITPGYWNRPEANAETITDGWLHTGDACRVDEDGHYFVVDRWKDMYISGGENVYPAEIESILFKMPEIADLAIIGVPDARWDEVGCAVIVVAPGKQLTADDVILFCQDKLARYKIPKHVVFMDELPRNATGKVLKRVLKDEIGDLERVN
ncbi:long-chain fatty acid--CoA ligase [Sneathiella sp. CAU 1612]|uniref:Long-chain fatty acid--CoA ligase n=1 Tax=Sneathiella sedimenti TaxID=2816034 RepID=A0ABS3F0J0_9PROT|nr:long-chain fatty acid--CoA ligase [Sneathiella sedimenti]MBO0332024.1 long-chain fatty acid--CoA ligase [Sneathiella sedimenti]